MFCQSYGESKPAVYMPHGPYTGAMGTRTRPGFRPLLLFAGLTLLLSAQYSWWIVNSLRENRKVLDLQRTVMAGEVNIAALQLESRLRLEARRFLELPPGVIPSAGGAFPQVEVKAGRRLPGWVVEGSRVAVAVPLTHNRHALAWLDDSAPGLWLQERASAFLLVSQGSPERDPPRADLGFPLHRWAVQADDDSWDQLLAGYRRRVVVVAVQAGLFFAVMAAAVTLLWTVFRKENAVEHQHQNFVSAVTHELKTPLAGIRLALETVLSDRVDEEGRRRFLTNALDDTDRLADLVGKVLEVTRYAQGAHRLDLELGDLSELVQEEVEAVARRTAPAGIRIETAIEAGIQAPFDPEALAIVLSNLLDNALKYSDADRHPILVRLFVQRGQAVVDVVDRGLGIDPEDLKRVFEPFFRSADQKIRRVSGTGIGLYVAREIVAAHGGRLTAVSEGRGRGATFRILLPGASTEADEEEGE